MGNVCPCAVYLLRVCVCARARGPKGSWLRAKRSLAHVSQGRPLKHSRWPVIPGVCCHVPRCTLSSCTQHTLRNAPLPPLISMCARLSGHKAVDRLPKSSLPSSIYVLAPSFDPLSNFPVLASPELAHRSCCVCCHGQLSQPRLSPPCASQSQLHRIASNLTAHCDDSSEQSGLRGTPRPTRL